MAKRGVRSARGEIVDFDLLKIKQQIASVPKPITVETRENFIDNKFKRRIKQQTQDAIDLATDEIIDVTVPSSTQTTTKSSKEK